MVCVNRDWFYRLASEVPSERVDAAASLIREVALLDSQNPEWQYVIKRLVQGLQSSRKGARLGFSLCLTEVLALAFDNGVIKSTEEYISMLPSLKEQGGSTDIRIKGKDERGLLFGRLFGLQALTIEPLFQKLFLSDSMKINQKFVLSFCEELIKLSIMKNWIREPTLYTLYQVVLKLLEEIDEDFGLKILQLLDQNNLTRTPEALAVWITLIHEGHCKITGKDVVWLNETWKNNDPLTKSNLPRLVTVLCVSTGPDEVQNNNQTNWSPKLHFVWDILLKYVQIASLDTHAIKKRKKNNQIKYIDFKGFWQMVVDESYFHERSSNERKYLGFLILIKALHSVTSPHDLIHCFTHNLVGCLINQSQNSKRYLNKIALKSLQAIVDVCESDPANKLVPIIKGLIFGPNGTINFDNLTKTKTIYKLIQIKLQEKETLVSIFELFIDHVSLDSNLQKSTQFALDSLLHVIKNQKSLIDKSVILHTIIEPITRIAFFNSENEWVGELAREKLFSIISELITVKNEDGQPWQTVVLMVINDLESKGEKLANGLDQSLQKVKFDATAVLKEVSEHQSSPMNRGLCILLSISLIQLLAGETESVTIIEELTSYYNDNKSMESLLGITEILLSFLAQKKVLLKKVSLQVWEQLVDSVGEDEIRLLLSCLESRENKQGFAQLFEGLDEYATDEGEEDTEDSEIENEDNEVSHAKGDDSSSDESSSDGNSSAVNANDEASKNLDQIDREATNALVRALKLPEDIIKDNGDVDIDRLEAIKDKNDFREGGDFHEDEGDVADEDDDSDDSDEMSMDDEQMMELDGQLSEIFKRRKEALNKISTGSQRKVEVKNSRESVILFKHRILDLLSSYLKYVEKLVVEKLEKDKAYVEDKCNILMLYLKPMIQCVNETLDRPLAEKIAKLMKTRLFKIKPIAFKANDQNNVMEILRYVHSEALFGKPGFHVQAHQSLCSTTSLFLGKVLVEQYEERSARLESYYKIIDIYADTTKKWFAGGKFSNSFFIEFVNWLSSRKDPKQ